MKHYILSCLLVLILGHTVFCDNSLAQNFNRPTPPTFPQYEFQRYDTTDLGGHFLIGPYLHNGVAGTSKGLAVIDQDGYLVWWTGDAKKMFDFKYHSDHQIYSFSSPRNGSARHFFLDENFNLIDSLQVPGTHFGDIHEVLMTPDGNTFVISVQNRNMDLSAYTFNGTQGSATTNVVDLAIMEYDPAHNLVFEWKAMDHLPPDVFRDGYYYNPGGFDVVHANAIEVDTDGNLLVSCRTADAIIKINKTTGAVMWFLGGNYNDFTFTNDVGFSGQHDIRLLPNGDISIFDNQFLLSQEGRAVRYSLDTVAMTATKTSEYGYLFPFRANSLGSYRVLDNDYSIVGWGNTRRPAPSVTLVDPAQNIAADFFFRDTVVTYRAFFETLPNLPQQPEIVCNDDGVNITLTAPSATFYLWSTGEGTQSITVADTGTYLVWVDQGIGMLGAQPFVISDLQDPCGTVGIEDNEPAGNRSIVAFYDLLGREIETPKRGQLYFIHYSDGTATKSVWQ